MPPDDPAASLPWSFGVRPVNPFLQPMLRSRHDRKGVNHGQDRTRATDNPARVAELRANPPPYDKSGLVGVALQACPGCDLRFATMTHRFVKGKETRAKVLATLLRLSPEVAAAMGDKTITARPAAGAKDAGESGEEDVAVDEA
jgi:hypothetical protein